MKYAQSSGITEFRLGELQFSIGPSPEPVYEMAERPLVVDDPVLSKENLESHEMMVKQDLLDTLKIADPLAYEQLIVEEELNLDEENLNGNGQTDS